MIVFFWSHPKSQNQSPPKMYQHQLELQSGEYLAQRDNENILTRITIIMLVVMAM